MKAYHGKQEIKDQYLKRVKDHELADQIMKGQYWDGVKGCAVGCTIHGSDHKAYETEIGIPEWLAKVEDELFEGMSEEKSKTWPRTFLESIKPGVDLDKVRVPFIVVVLKRNLKSLDECDFDVDKFPDVKDAIEQSKEAVHQMIEAQESGDKEKIVAAESAAESAAWSAWSAARSAESAARSAARSAESAARSAARSAAWSAWSAARSAESAAESARSAARSAAESARSAARSAAESAARSAAFNYFADELIKILKEVDK